MKKLVKLLGIIALIAVIGFSMTACEEDEDDFSLFAGTWVGIDPDGDPVQIVVSGSRWTMSWPGNPHWGSESGTFTSSGNSATLRLDGVTIGTATISGNTLTVSISEWGIMVLTRQGSSGNNPGGDTPGGNNQFIGTWNGIDPDGDPVQIVVTSTGWTMSWPGNSHWGSDSGTYTSSGNVATLRLDGVTTIGTATVSGNSLTVSIQGWGIMTLTRQGGSNPGGGSNSFIGTWVGLDPDWDQVMIVVTSTGWTMSWPGNSHWGTESGTYTFSGNVATLREFGQVIGTATVSGNSLTVNIPNWGTMVLTRQ
jgi:hypothetical protein